MSNLDNEIDADLLGLVDGDDDQTSFKSSSKRKESELTDSGEDDDGGYDDQQTETQAVDDDNPYPLEGKYKNAADRANLMDLDELEREDILASRQEEMQKYKDSLNINKLFSAAQAIGDDSVSSAAKRSHKQTGATVEKKNKLEELRSKREAKTKRRSRHDYDDDKYYDKSDLQRSSQSLSDSEEGELNRDEEKDEKPIDTADIHKVSISRTMLADFCYAPFFEDFVKGTFVRYLLGERDGKPDYRLCEVVGLGDSLTRPYAIDGNTMTNQQLVLKQGRASKPCNMDKVSNSRCTDREFDRFVAHAKYEKARLPTRKTIEMVRTQIEETRKRPWSEADINFKLQKKAAVMGGTLKKNVALEKAELQQRLQLARARRDVQEAEYLFQKLEAMEDDVYRGPSVDKFKQYQPQQHSIKSKGPKVRKLDKTKLKDDDVSDNIDMTLAISGKSSSKLELIIQSCTYDIEG
ncbi:hypothetical protein E3Q23_01406 [Wallemia mellicola]|uniref:Plus-3-domain-containing protein n=1 Tax=Wallemia mellicola TaxID=1708541 RepID=A0A4T0QK67_9BASI|nr:hypothetical protein E3Q24_00897 [Wallemia mellicola]TIB77225.1 hypothetical protein E3Q23_01406 [Wallemia mellicola]TIC01383.1 plus-3-domain-containing protein [Wallemia mellicola]TIC24769.1 plus-3-domain-containing protein [Wallemia mellicola]TIC43612.1 plus-3-domain-containing protein [Wallemia mellicola]